MSDLNIFTSENLIKGNQSDSKNLIPKNFFDDFESENLTVLGYLQIPYQELINRFGEPSDIGIFIPYYAQNVNNHYNFYVKIDDIKFIINEYYEGIAGQDWRIIGINYPNRYTKHILREHLNKNKGKVILSWNEDHCFIEAVDNEKIYNDFANTDEEYMEFLFDDLNSAENDIFFFLEGLEIEKRRKDLHYVGETYNIYNLGKITKILNYISSHYSMKKLIDDQNKKIAYLECEPYRGKDFFEMIREEKESGFILI